MTTSSCMRRTWEGALSAGLRDEPSTPRATNIYYLAHDLNDAAVVRRLNQLQRGGAEVVLAGFTRRSSSRPPSANVVSHLGTTQDGRFARRIFSILRTALAVRRWGSAARNADVLIARNLEMMVLAMALRLTCCSNAPIVYECLDIHRLMIHGGIIGKALRFVERRVLRFCSLLIVSSPSFIDNYFRRNHDDLPPILLWENKMLACEQVHVEVTSRPAIAAPWRIGWFGVIRCRRSLLALRRLCTALPGLVEVDIRGRPTEELLPYVEAAAATTPGIAFRGAYDRSSDLASIYGCVHFAWAIDFFEDGANSDWLLPNRLYEGAAHFAVPIALSGVETGRWLLRHGLGVVLNDASDEALTAFFESLSAPAYLSFSTQIEAVDRSIFQQDDDELRATVQKLTQLVPRGPLIENVTVHE